MRLNPRFNRPIIFLDGLVSFFKQRFSARRAKLLAWKNRAAAIRTDSGWFVWGWLNRQLRHSGRWIFGHRVSRFVRWGRSNNYLFWWSLRRWFRRGRNIYDLADAGNDRRGKPMFDHCPTVGAIGKIRRVRLSTRPTDNSCRGFIFRWSRVRE